MADIFTGPQAADRMAGWHSYPHRFCLQAVSRAFQNGDATHASTVSPLVEVGTASQHWAAMPANLKHPGDRNYGTIPKGAVVQLVGGDGHIFISVGGGRGVSTDYPSPGVVSVAPIADIVNHFSGNPYAGWGEWINGRQISLAQPVGPTQRQVLAAAPVRRRTGPGTHFPEKGAQLEAGTVGNFVAFAHGNPRDGQPAGNDVWYKGISGDWFWAGGFTRTDGSNLADLSADFADKPAPAVVLDESYKTFTADSPLATWVGSPNYGKRPAVLPKDHITLHWMDGYLAGTDATFQSLADGVGPNGHGLGVATTYGVGPNAVHQYVKENEYHHGDGDAASNASGISIEHEGGPAIPIQDATYDRSIALCADVAKRLGLGKLVLGANVFPHNHYASTACPGTLDMQRIVDGANRLNGYDEPADPAGPGEADPGDGTDGGGTTEPPSDGGVTPSPAKAGPFSGKVWAALIGAIAVVGAALVAWLTTLGH
jgi:hypothetical protein